MINIRYKLGEGAKTPIQGHTTDAGYDIFASSEPEIKGRCVGEVDGVKLYKDIDYIQYRTGLFVSGECLGEIVRFDLRPRSSVSKYWLTLCNPPATIDHDYRGEILVRFRYNFQMSDINFTRRAIRINMDKIYNKGDRICQLMGGIVEPLSLYEVDSVDDLHPTHTSRADGGFGSTDKKVK